MIWSLPELDNPILKDFAAQLGCEELQRIPVQPDIFTTELHCYNNVQLKVALLGGDIVSGYLFAEYYGGIDFQAVRHTVWQDYMNDLIDITPFRDERNFNIFGRTCGRPTIRSAFYQSLELYKRRDGSEKTYYVYLLMDPRKNIPFYVGKGSGNRAKQHLWKISREHNPYKDNVIASIRREGLEPEIIIVAEDILDESLAYDLEAKLIKFWGRKSYDKGGILTNVCEDFRPPNVRGMTYEEIYGIEEAQRQKTKRRHIQIARGGYGPKRHSDVTRAKLRITNGGKRNGRYGKPTSLVTRQKIAARLRQNVGVLNKLSHHYVLRSPTGGQHVMHGWTEVRAFCRLHNLSEATFHANVYKGWPPSRRGKNVGWTIQHQL